MRRRGDDDLTPGAVHVGVGVAALAFEGHRAAEHSSAGGQAAALGSEAGDLAGGMEAHRDPAKPGELGAY